MFKLLILFLGVPLGFYLSLPWGGTPSNQFIVIAILSSLSIIFGLQLGKAVGGVTFRRHRHKISYNLKKLKLIFLFISALLIVFNLYLHQAIGFQSALFNINIRNKVYEVAGFFWALNVSIYSMLAAITAYLIQAEKKIRHYQILLIVPLVIMATNYGMKGLLLQIFIPFSVVQFWIQPDPLKHVAMRIKETSQFKIYAKHIIMGLAIFFIINAARSGGGYNAISLVTEIYFYLIPPFANFNQIVGQEYYFPYILGGVFEPFYRLFNPDVRPLHLLDNGELVHPTWNVWSYYANFYAAGGTTEVILGSLYIGIFCGIFDAKIRTTPNLTILLGYSQGVLVMLTLHNSYYLQSSSPYFVILLAYLIHKLCKN